LSTVLFIAMAQYSGRLMH